MYFKNPEYYGFVKRRVWIFCWIRRLRYRTSSAIKCERKREVEVADRFDVHGEGWSARETDDRESGLTAAFAFSLSRSLWRRPLILASADIWSIIRHRMSKVAPAGISGALFLVAAYEIPRWQANALPLVSSLRRIRCVAAVCLKISVCRSKNLLWKNK